MKRTSIAPAHGALQRLALVAALACGSGICPADDIEIVPVPIMLEMVQQRFLWNEASLLAGARITQLVSKSEGQLDADDVEQVIDSDPCSGATLASKGQFRFLVNLHKIARVRQVTLVGMFARSTATIQITGEGLGPNDSGWICIAKDQALQTPTTSVVFRPQPVLQALVTIQAHAPPDTLAPTINDISIFSDRDVREFELASRAKPSFAGFAESAPSGYSDVRNPNSIFNLSGMYADARVCYVTPPPPTENVNAINDGNPDTSCGFDPQKTETLAVMDLGQARRIRKLSFVHSPQPGRLSCYAVKSLPWEPPPHQPTALLAWLPFPGGSMAADFPLLAQLGTPGNTPRPMAVASSLVDSFPRVGTLRTDATCFSRFNLGQANDARFVVIRHTNTGDDDGGRAGGGGGGGVAGGAITSLGFRINDMSTLGECSPSEFMLVQRDLPPLRSEPLITMPAAAAAATEDNDTTKLGIVKPPPPASPSTP